MRIKAKEIAQELGLSEATVSLALNNRSGSQCQYKKADFGMCKSKAGERTEEF